MHGTGQPVSECKPHLRENRVYSIRASLAIPIPWRVFNSHFTSFHLRGMSDTLVYWGKWPFYKFSLKRNVSGFRHLRTF